MPRHSSKLSASFGNVGSLMATGLFWRAGVAALDRACFLSRAPMSLKSFALLRELLLQLRDNSGMSPGPAPRTVATTWTACGNTANLAVRRAVPRVRPRRGRGGGRRLTVPASISAAGESSIVPFAAMPRLAHLASLNPHKVRNCRPRTSESPPMLALFGHSEGSIDLRGEAGALRSVRVSHYRRSEPCTLPSPVPSRGSPARRRGMPRHSSPDGLVVADRDHPRPVDGRRPRRVPSPTCSGRLTRVASRPSRATSDARSDRHHLLQCLGVPPPGSTMSLT